MAWTNYRNVVDRFSHIDAEFVKSMSRCSSDAATAELVVRFDPWWEHPQYLSAVRRGERWGFSSHEAGKREVTVRAIRPWACRLSIRTEVIEWRFVQEHPLLWDYAGQSTIFVNAPFDRSVLFERLMTLAPPNVTYADLIAHVSLPATSTAPMGLMVSDRLHEAVLTVFDQLGVPTFSSSTPGPTTPGVVFLIDEDDYIIADDFEVDVPEFIHQPEWFETVEKRDP